MKMLSSLWLLACNFLLLSTGLSAPSGPSYLRNTSVITRNTLSKRAEPTTGDDLPDTPNHPNLLDQVETGFQDAIELASFVIQNIDTDTTIFPHYFDEGDRAGVKNVFAAILGSTSVPNGPTDGNALLGNIFVQTTDEDHECDVGNLLAFMDGHETSNPNIVVCPILFRKKAVTLLNGAPNPDDNPDDAQWYINCNEIRANGHVSYLFNTLGSTLLHEYLHFDELVESIFGASIIDQPDGYGPFFVYDNLSHDLSPLNADSYMYYASEILLTEICPGPDAFLPPRDGIDNVDPDCLDSICQM